MADRRLARISVRVSQAMRKERSLISRLLKEWRSWIHVADIYTPVRQEAQRLYGDPENWTLDALYAAFPELPMRLFHEFDRKISMAECCRLLLEPKKSKLIDRFFYYDDRVKGTPWQNSYGVVVECGGLYVLHNVLEVQGAPSWPIVDGETGKCRLPWVAQLIIRVDDDRIVIWDSLEGVAMALKWLRWR